MQQDRAIERRSLVEEGGNFDDYVTNDMAIVAYLKLNGHAPQRVEVGDDDECRWRFYVIANFFELVEEFLEDEALVNPREYNKFFGQVKKEMYRAQDNRH